MERFLEKQTAYGYGGQGSKAGTADREGATVVQTSCSIRVFHFSSDKKYLDRYFINPELLMFYTAYSLYYNKNHCLLLTCL